MPDLITHVALSHFAIRFYELKKGHTKIWPWRLLFYFGTVLPDILTRPVYILFPLKNLWTIGIHNPLPILAVCGIIALLFTEGIRLKVFYYLSAGALIHFLLDSFQKHLVPHNYWLFPFSWQNWGIELFHPSEFMAFIPLYILCLLIFEGILFLIKKRGS